uniref:Protein kinase domain-containing protein n=1 Tax=Phaeomonas parva TaxID=124430 RepID=A0A7S1XTD7_9STRA|mmetsp:Transcript_31679/g.100614  ORF Transcript_31679/g.100614 Transcript_31679/m.100614 type:complete len:678 (+) Transcript_31679:455-2488(+)
MASLMRQLSSRFSLGGCVADGARTPSDAGSPAGEQPTVLAARPVKQADGLDLGPPLAAVQKLDQVPRKGGAIARAVTAGDMRNGSVADAEVEERREAEGPEGSPVGLTIDEDDLDHYDIDDRGLDVRGVELLRLIGHGAFGRVHLSRVHFRPGLADKFCALKSMSKTHMILAGRAMQVAEEQRLLQKVHSHPFVLTVLSGFQTSTHVHLITELVPNGELCTHLRRQRRLPEATARFYAAQVLLALEHCHEQGVIFRDLKPENVLLCGRGHARLADFGLAVDIRRRPCVDGAHTPRLFTLCGSDDYVAPEVLRGHGYGPAADLWALGCLTYEMLTGVAPFHELTLPRAADALQKVRAREKVVKRQWPQEPPGSVLGKGGVKITDARHATFTRILMEPAVVPNQFSDEAQEFLLGLLQKSPVKRTGFLAGQRAVAAVCAPAGSVSATVSRNNSGSPSAGSSGESPAADAVSSTGVPASRSRLRLSTPECIFRSEGLYDECVKAAPFFAPLGGVTVTNLVDEDGPLPAPDRTISKAVSGFFQRAAEASREAFGISRSQKEEDSWPELPFVGRDMLGVSMGLPLENCAEASAFLGKGSGDAAGARAKLDTLRALSYTIFPDYAHAPDELVYLCGERQPRSPDPAASNPATEPPTPEEDDAADAADPAAAAEDEAEEDEVLD